MRILFYHPTSMSDGYPEPPLGLGYLMSIAARLGFEYEFHDEDHHGRNFSLEGLIKDLRPDIYAVSFMTPQCFEAARKIRMFNELTPHAKIIVGGPHPSALPMETMREMPEVDYLCKGEGEKTFEDFLRFLAGKERIEQINGLFWREGEAVRANTPRELMDQVELDSYPVDWEKIMEKGPYPQKLPYTPEIVPALSVITTRGCPFECTFCDEGSIWNRRVRMRSIDNVIGELTFLARKFNVRDFDILDDTFTLNKARVADFCRKAEPLGIRFKITAKTKTVDAGMLAALKGAGCQLIGYGVESGDEEVLKKMKKKQTLEDIRRAFDLTRKAGIASYALCMVGNIGEDMEAVRKTARLIGEIRPDMFSCSIMTPYPGSENYKICNKNGWILHHEWEHWVPSALKTKGFRPVARTDKMGPAELIKAYYFMNRYVLKARFRRKYGRFYAVRPLFYRNEFLPRLKTIGPRAFSKHFMDMFVKRWGTFSWRKAG